MTDFFTTKDVTDWIGYLEADPPREPYLSIAKAWRADRAEIKRLQEFCRQWEVLSLVKLKEDNERLRALLRRVVEWEPGLPTEASLIDEINAELKS